MADYHDQGRIGKGGCGEVVACQRIPDGTRFAKKILFPNASKQLIERFRQEVRILSMLDHPNIIKVLDSQLTAAPFWYVMPHYQTSLRDELNSVIGNDARIQRLFGAILDGVEYAHREGVIHRDLKAHNVMMNGDDDVVVTDFGIGRILDADGDRFTFTGQPMGTSWYASPEQMSDAKHVDGRSDIYNLGRMLYELYTEKLTSQLQNLQRLPPNLVAIVDRCTQGRPEDRYQTISDLKDAWRAANEVTTADSGIGESQRLVTELGATPVIRAKVQRLLQLLTQHVLDDDLLRRSMMLVPVASVALMLEIDTEAVRSLIRSFVSHVLSQGWGASFLDKLGIRCGNLFLSVSDPQIRAELVYCNLIIGVKYRRYGVLETLAQLLQVVHSPVEVKAIQERLKSVPADVRKEAGRWLDFSGIDPKLTTLFQN